jgi:hypothetical protein
MEDAVMAESYRPVVGEWYCNLETGDLFEVVALDEDSGTIGIQYFEGEVEEIDSDTWTELMLEPSAEPEDWSAPFDDLEPEEVNYGETLRPENWSGPFKDIDRED